MRHSKSKEHFKFQGIDSFENLVQENWDESSTLDFLDSSKFLLLVFNDFNQKKPNGNSYEHDPEKIIFVGAKFWHMPTKDINGPCKYVWNTEINKLKTGIELTYTVQSHKNIRVYNNFIKPSLEDILHIRPDAGKSQYQPPYIEEGKLKNNSRKLPTPAVWHNRPDSEKDNYTNDYITKQAWWLSKDYIFEQVKDLLT